MKPRPVCRDAKGDGNVERLFFAEHRDLEDRICQLQNHGRNTAHFIADNKRGLLAPVIPKNVRCQIIRNRFLRLFKRQNSPSFFLQFFDECIDVLHKFPSYALFRAQSNLREIRPNLPKPINGYRRDAAKIELQEPRAVRSTENGANIMDAPNIMKNADQPHVLIVSRNAPRVHSHAETVSSEGSLGDSATEDTAAVADATGDADETETPPTGPEPPPDGMFAPEDVV